MKQKADETHASRLYMLGVIHRDPRTPVLLRQWITDIKPDIITLEFSQYGLMFRKENHDRYKKRIDEVLKKLKNNKTCKNHKGPTSIMPLFKTCS